MYFGLVAIFNTAIIAFKRNWLSALILQLLGISIILLYYFFPPFHHVLQQIANIQRQGGLYFSAIITAIFAGLFPFFLQIVLERERLDKTHIKKAIFIVLFWAYRGIEVDFLYKLQAMLFGDAVTVSIIIKKTLVDQIIYGPLWANWIVTFGVLFKDQNLSFSRTCKQIDKNFIRLHYPSIVFSSWMIWIPGVIIIYSLPQLLQVPMMNIVACFYAILVMYMTRHRRGLTAA